MDEFALLPNWPDWAKDGTELAMTFAETLSPQAFIPFATGYSFAVAMAIRAEEQEQGDY